MKRTLNTKEKAVLEVMSKPKIPSEIREQSGLHSKSSISPVIKRLVASNLIYCLMPKARVGKLYGLTKKGIILRRRLGFTDYCQPTDINWNLYGWVVCGKQRKAILKSMTPAIPMTPRTIRENALSYNTKISRTNCYDVLKTLGRIKLTTMVRKNHWVFHLLRRKGHRIKEQITA